MRMTMETTTKTPLPLLLSILQNPFLSSLLSLIPSSLAVPSLSSSLSQSLSFFFFFIDMNMLLCYLFIFYFFLFTWIAREASSLPFPLQACPLSKNQHCIWFGLHLFCQFHPIMWLHPSFYINFFFIHVLLWFDFSMLVLVFGYYKSYIRMNPSGPWFF